jgi:uncharacterized protein
VKFLLWLLLILVVLHLLRKKKAGLAASMRAAATAATQRRCYSVKPAAIESMLPCAYCGIHIPHSESITATGGQVFCSDAHRQRYRAA